MNTPTRIVVAVGSGYLLGRTKKLKFAIAVGGAVTGTRLPTSTADLLRLGWRLVDVSPELTRLKSAVRGQLLVAGRTAAIAAASHHLEALTQRLTVQLEQLETAPAAAIETQNASPPALPGAALPSADPGTTDDPMARNTKDSPGEDKTVEPIWVTVADGAAAPDPDGTDGHVAALSSARGRVSEGATA